MKKLIKLISAIFLVSLLFSCEITFYTTDDEIDYTVTAYNNIGYTVNSMFVLTESQYNSFLSYYETNGYASSITYCNNMGTTVNGRQACIN